MGILSKVKKKVKEIKEAAPYWKSAIDFPDSYREAGYNAGTKVKNMKQNITRPYYEIKQNVSDFKSGFQQGVTPLKTQPTYEVTGPEKASKEQLFEQVKQMMGRRRRTR